MGDACDPCTGGVPVAKERLTLAGVTTPGGDDKLRFRGSMTLRFPFSPPLDPASRGVRIRLVDAAAMTILDATLPGGAYEYATQTGWKVNPSGTKWIYRNGLGGVQGLTKATIKVVASSPGLVQFTVSGTSGTYWDPRFNTPVAGTFILDPGQCGEATFPGPPLPSCWLNASGTTLVCK